MLCLSELDDDPLQNGFSSPVLILTDEASLLRHAGNSTRRIEVIRLSQCQVLIDLETQRKCMLNLQWPLDCGASESLVISAGRLWIAVQASSPVTVPHRAHLYLSPTEPAGKSSRPPLLSSLSPLKPFTRSASSLNSL
jgi:hypothetical protein